MTVDCPLCGRAYPDDEIEDHASACTGGDEEQAGQNDAEADNTNTVACPLCNKEFAVAAIEAHASGCGGGEDVVEIVDSPPKKERKRKAETVVVLDEESPAKPLPQKRRKVDEDTGPEALVECGVGSCRAVCPVGQTVSLYGCGHRLCRACLQALCQAVVADTQPRGKEDYNLAALCPGCPVEGCGQGLRWRDIAEGLGSSQSSELLGHVVAWIDAALRAQPPLCPACRGSKGRGGAGPRWQGAQQVRCGKCGTTYCPACTVPIDHGQVCCQRQATLQAVDALDQLVEAWGQMDDVVAKVRGRKKSSKSKGRGTGYGGQANDKINQKVLDSIKQQQQQRDATLTEALRAVCQAIPAFLDNEGSMQATDFVWLPVFHRQAATLQQVLATLFTNDAIMDIATRDGLYLQGLLLTKRLAAHPDLAYIIVTEVGEDEEGPSRSILQCLRDLHMQAKFLTGGQLSHVEDETATCALAMGLEISETHDMVCALAENAPLLGIGIHKRGRDVEGEESEGSGGEGDGEEAAARRYCEAMRDKRLEQADICSGQYTYHKELSKDTPSGLLIRVSKEVSSLATSLPLAYDSTIFVRVDESRMDVLKALVVGPPDTPYEDGLFEFDIHLPASYPNVPPHVSLVTTGRGAVRFNPNLYNCGKVCLSLLGTWSGPGWSAGTSTLLQVLISIQSLIMVDQPYSNEPGFEHHGHSEEARGYSQAVRYATMRYAMLDHIKNPPSVFGEVARQHFALKAAHIRSRLNEWLATLPADIKGRAKQGADMVVKGCTTKAIRDTAKELDAVLASL